MTNNKSNKKYTVDEAKQLMIDYAQNKYGKKFEAVGELGHVNFSNSSPLELYLCEVGKYDSEEENVFKQAYVFEIELKIDGDKHIFSDNYARLYYRDIMKSQIEQLINNEIDDEIVYPSISAIILEEPKYPLTLDEAIENRIIDGDPYVVIFVEENKYTINQVKEISSKIKKILETKFKAGSTNIQILDSETYYHLQGMDVATFFKKEYSHAEKYNQSFYANNRVEEKWGEDNE